MINCLSYDNKRGFVVLNSKEVRDLEYVLMHYHSNAACIKLYLEIVLKRVQEDNYGLIEGTAFNDVEHHLKTCLDWFEESKKYIEKAQDVLR